MPGSRSSPRLLPADLCVAGYGLAVGLLWLPFAGSSPTARSYLLLHVVLLAIPLLLAGADPPPRWRRPLLRDIYPLLLLAVFWAELGARYQVAGGVSHDAVIAALDQSLFAGQPSLLWSRVAPANWIRQVMESAYLAYYPVLIGIPVWILRAGHRRAVRELVLYVSVVYLGCFLVYAVYPVVGPFHFFGLVHAEGPTTGLQRIDGLIRNTGDSLGTAFPSSHVAGSVVFALVASRWCPRWVGWGCWAVAALVSLAVVYTHHHYAADALGGAMLALAAHAGIRAVRAGARTSAGRLASPTRLAAPTAPGAPSLA